MGKFKKESNTVRKRCFGQPCGRNSYAAKQKEKARLLKIEENIFMYQKEKGGSFDHINLLEDIPIR